MAKAVFLWPAGSDVRLGEAEARELARLGISAIALVRGDGTVGVVIDGWAFDPTRHAEAAAAALSAAPTSGRLLPVAEIGVSSAALEGGLDARTSAIPRPRGRGSAPGAVGDDGGGAHPHDRA